MTFLFAPLRAWNLLTPNIAQKKKYVRHAALSGYGKKYRNSITD